MNVLNEMMKTVVEKLKEQNENVAMFETHGSNFRALDAALDGGAYYRIAVIKYEREELRISAV
ncbi:MAG: hypothetical protein LBT20_01050 [Clostridiales bacterium]|jgi:hypothetical protein|nr:hypothetical protein [Clostridiales bacterium]